MRRRTVLRTTLLAAALLLAAPMGTSREIARAETHSSEAIPRLLALYSTQRPVADQRSVRALELLQRFYSSVGNILVWTDDDFSLARQALQQLRDADQHGLVPDDYLVRAPIPHDTEHDPEQLARFDIELTSAVLGFLADLHSGRTAPDVSWFGGTLERRSFDPTDNLRQALRQRHLDEAINDAQPRNALYHRVKQTLAQYRQLEPRYRELGPLPPLPAGGKLRPGMAYEGAAGLLERLVLLGDMPNSAVAATDGMYSGVMEAGVRRFQFRHGLQQDGIPGKATMSALAVPLSHRIRQLELTLERLRWMPTLPPGPLIVVNVPSFRLWALDTRVPSSGPQVEMRVIVGTAARTPTPLFIGQLRYLEFNPAWNVPRSIELDEIMPKLARDPDYLRKQDMELVSMDGKPVSGATPQLKALQAGTVRVRQRPGARNVLGAVKFAMPNPMSIYLHATSAKELFAMPRRDLSHGCIRLEQPAELAEYVLRDEGNWDRASVLRAMAPGPTRTVRLGTPIPVVLLYATAVTDSQGRALFLPDIYALDQKLIRMLALERVGPLTD